MHAEATLRTDGVQLTKYFEEDEFPLPSVVYKFSSEREETVIVRLVEQIPESLEQEDLGFHRGLGAENWTATGQKLVLETEIETESEQKSVYALRPSASVEVEELLTSPDEFTITPKKKMLMRGGTSASVPRSTSSSTAENADRVDRRNSDSEAESGSQEPEESTPNIEEKLETHLEEQTTAQEFDLSGNEAQDQERPLVDQLVAELQSGRVSDDSLEYLEQRFGTVQNGSGSVDARVTQLQQDLADLRAYTNALEQFLDEHGSAEEVVESFEARLESFDGDLDSLESTVTEQGNDVSAVQEELQSVRSEVKSLATEISAVSDEIETLSSELERVDEQLPDQDIEARFMELESDISEVSEFTTTLQNAFQENLQN